MEDPPCDTQAPGGEAKRRPEMLERTNRVVLPTSALQVKQRRHLWCVEPRGAAFGRVSGIYLPIPNREGILRVVAAAGARRVTASEPKHTSPPMAGMVTIG